MWAERASEESGLANPETREKDKIMQCGNSSPGQMLIEAHVQQESESKSGQVLWEFQDF
jgi:hypothetical protein